MDVSVTDIETIEELAAQNFTIREIAITLGVKYSSFIVFCEDEFHPVGKAFLKGRLEIDRVKNENLLLKVESGSETAIQIHDNKAKEQAFLDIKSDMFSGFDE